MKCKVCGNDIDLFGSASVLGKYSVSYYLCHHCGFMQTEQPYWLDEAYSKTITRSDIGLVSRNMQMADITQKLILTCLEPNERFIDYGGGYGMFVRLMRDNGFQFDRYDPLCENLFSEGFDAQPGSKYSLLTSWEVFEHLTDPLAEIEKMLSFSRTLFFSTSLLSSPPQLLKSWWYYGLEHGQHVAFYSTKTLQMIAEKFNLRLSYSSGAIHLLSDNNVNPILLRLAFGRFRLLRKLFSKPQPASLLEHDFQKITGQNLRNNEG
jgi:hypothetical protein